MTRPTGPPPTSPETQRYRDAAARQQLLVPRCADCGRFHWYPRALCPHCFSSNLTPIPATGRGVLYSFSLLRRETPAYVLAFVTLEEGVTMMTRIVDCDADDLRIGQSVGLVFQSPDDGPPLAMFRPVPNP